MPTKISVLSITALILLCFMIASEYYVVPDKPFSVEGYYRGSTTVGGEDPKSAYANYASNANSNSMCLLSTRTADHVVRTPETGVYWVCGYEQPTKFEEVKAEASLREFDGGKCLKPFTNGQAIVAPGTFTFMNSNCDYTTGKIINIEGTVGDYKIIFYNVQNWWCHEGQQGEKHSIQYGHGTSNVEKVGAGVVIGVASTNTEVRVQKRNDDGKYDYINPLDYFK